MEYYIDFTLAIDAPQEAIDVCVEVSDEAFGGQSDAIEAAEDMAAGWPGSIIGYTVTQS